MITFNKIVDLSVDVSPEHWEPEPIKREVLNHKEGADKLGKSYLYYQNTSFWRKWWIKLTQSKQFFIDHKDFPDSMGLSLMTYTLTTHTGTHIDAPYHYGWRTSARQSPKTITDIPLSWCIGRGVMLDFSAGAVRIGATQVEEECNRIGHSIEAGDIVLINTGAFAKLGTPEYFTNYQAIEKSALEWLTARGVRIVGTDAFSFDPPFCEMIDEYKQSGNNKSLWPAHFYGRDREYIQIERLGHLDELPSPTGFQVCCFPVKLKGADAAWSRVVAFVD